MAAVKGVARILVTAGSAKPSPAIGQALGPLGVNMMEFCKDFNAKTGNFKPTALMRVRLTAFEDRTFKYVIMAPPTSWYLKRVTGLSKGFGTPKERTAAGEISVRAIYEIAKSKQQYDPFLGSLDTEALAKSIAGSAKAMGLKLVR
jgi:large subunit ribosomal protein L11